MTQDNKRDYAQRRSAPNEKAGYMSQLEDWIAEQVIEPLYLNFAEGDKDFTLEAIDAATKAIKNKILESYRNGQQAQGAKEAYQGQKNRSNRPSFGKAFGEKGDRADVRKA